MAEIRFFLQLVTGIIFTIAAAIVVVWACDRLCGWLWREGDPKEPH